MKYHVKDETEDTMDVTDESTAGVNQVEQTMTQHKIREKKSGKSGGTALKTTRNEGVTDGQT